MGEMLPRPFTVATLADRWGCSEGAIRNRIRAGEVRSFKIGALVRIPAAEVERVECLNTLSSVSEAGTPSSITKPLADAGERSLPRPIGLERRPRPGRDGALVTDHRERSAR
jgi:excisionase family DNA binding protein